MDFFYCENCWEKGTHKIEKNHHKVDSEEVNRLSPEEIQKRFIFALHNEDLIGIISYLEQGASLFTCVDEFGNYPIHIACYSSSDDVCLKILKIFMNYKVDLDCENLNKDTPLKFLVFQGYIESLKFLIENGLDLKQKKYENLLYFHLTNVSKSSKERKENKFEKYEKSISDLEFQERKKTNIEIENELEEWIEDLTNEKFLKPGFFYESLMDGHLLCKVINFIKRLKIYSNEIVNFNLFILDTYKLFF